MIWNSEVSSEKRKRMMHLSGTSTPLRSLFEVLCSQWGTLSDKQTKEHEARAVKFPGACRSPPFDPQT